MHISIATKLTTLLGLIAFLGDAKVKYSFNTLILWSLQPLEMEIANHC